MTARLLLVSLLLTTSLQAQEKTPRWVLGAALGGVSPADNFGVGVDWKSGWSAAANLTYKVTTNLGIRGDATFAQNDLSGGGIPGEGRLNKFAYMGNAVWQAVGMTSERLHPYALAGLGAVRVHAKGSDSSFTRFGGDIGFGFGYRLGRLGLRAEGRDVMYKFDRFGYNKTQNDLVWEGGVTVGL
ncbi:MAG TPA: outer membrane beta-barrel protein [Gemmatimonadales bacterium]|jgi:opacity protein-like surface antigen|nr:outer membrane beta-barrel protein [Gemmatimonadales bacterium]